MNLEAPVLWQERDGVGHIILNRAEHANAIDLPGARAFVAAVDAAAGSQVGAIVLSARGKQFCAGGDIRAFIARRDDLAALVNEILCHVHPAMHKLATLPVPVVSAVQGPIGGAGIAVALCADIVLAADTAKLRGGYTAIGLSPDAGASYFATRRAGAAAAKRIFMCNETLQADEMLRLGLVDALHPAAGLQDRAEALARQLAAGARGSMAAVKRLCDSAASNDLKTHLDLEQKLLLERARSDDSREGIQAFIDKRAPKFSSTTFS